MLKILFKIEHLLCNEVILVYLNELTCSRSPDHLCERGSEIYEQYRYL